MRRKQCSDSILCWTKAVSRLCKHLFKTAESAAHKRSRLRGCRGTPFLANGCFSFYLHAQNTSWLSIPTFGRAAGAPGGCTLLIGGSFKQGASRKSERQLALKWVISHRFTVEDHHYHIHKRGWWIDDFPWASPSWHLGITGCSFTNRSHL